MSRYFYELILTRESLSDYDVSSVYSPKSLVIVDNLEGLTESSKRDVRASLRVRTRVFQ